MNRRWGLFVSCWCGIPSVALAAVPAGVSPGGSMLKIVLGLLVVLAVMALISWVIKRIMSGSVGQRSVVRIVGGVSVGSRERVVVVEVADRWFVIGVAPGQVNSIANLEKGTGQLPEQLAQNTTTIPPDLNLASLSNPLVHPFSQWLKKSTDKARAKFTEKSDAKE